MQQLTTYIRHPEQLVPDDIEQIGSLLSRYPYFEGARLLYVRGLFQQQDDRFGAELRRAAIAVPDRTKLFQLIEGTGLRHTPDVRRPKLDTDAMPAADRTQALIDSFLAGQTEAATPARQRPVDASVDYMAYLMQQEQSEAGEPQQPVASPMNHQQLIDDFLDKEQGRITLPPQPQEPASGKTPADAAGSPAADDAPADSETDAATSENGTEEAFLTETLARIYIKQGKYIKAIEIIRRLSLRNPKKNRYFADQIRFLDKLIVNERAKNN